MPELYLDNPARRSRRARRRRSKKRPTRKQLAARKKFARMARARAKAKKRTKRVHRRKPTMARRKRTHRRTRRHRPRSGVRLVRRGVTVYQGNRGRRRHRRRYRHNPTLRGVFGQVQQLAVDTGLTLVGGAGGRTIGGMLPAFANPFADAAKGTLVALGLRWVGVRFLGAERGRFIAAGAMQPVLKNLIVGLVPGLSPFLGDYEPMGAYSLSDAYPGGGYLADGSTTVPGDMAMSGNEEIGAYEIY